MSNHRFYISPKAWSATAPVLEGSEAHHCVEVLRLGLGARVVAFNGQGSEITGEIVEVSKERVRLKPILFGRSPKLRCAITLAQAIPKGKNMELIVQKATELGVSRIVPLLSERTIVHLDAAESQKRVEKWRQVVIEAAKQCGQNWLPEIVAPLAPKQFFAEFDRYEAALIASLQSDARSFRNVLHEFRDQHGRRPQSALILIGPEGDFTPAEAAFAKSAGCVPVTLGPIVLRTETAAIYSLSVLAYELQGEDT
ncbi:MAG: 16S rRNA (uracil(1498)-N(3))-methyltransferase [Verrucomicrobia bacterium]|nr:16S rRNA (uracil(1498)-N(3))-methyltransferase [Verrucomicrobiota bacterium]